jgi:regulator of replication initiation timing
MKSKDDTKERLLQLEDRIRRFIEVHESLKASGQRLAEENARLVAELEEERNKSRRLDEGYRNLKQQETAATRQQVARINNRINDLVSEIDKNIKLIEV